MTNSTQQLRSTSPAFLQALLQSERLRIRIVIAAIVAAFALRTIRTAILFNHENLNLWLVTTSFIAVFLVFELLMLRAVNHALKDGHDLPNAAWITNIVVETCIPALGLAFLSGGLVLLCYKKPRKQHGHRAEIGPGGLRFGGAGWRWSGDYAFRFLPAAPRGV